jgi:hypothetical protein
MNEKVITAEDCDLAFTTLATWRSLEEYNSAGGNTAEASRFSAYYTAGLVLLGDILDESYRAIDRAVDLRYAEIYGA